MTLRYKNTFGDLLAFSFYNSSRSPVLGIVLLLFLLMTVPSTWSSVAKQQDTSTLVRVLVFLIMEGMLLLVVLLGTVLIAIGSHLSHSNKTALTEHTLTIDEESFTEETAYNRTDYQWAAIQKLGQTKRHIFIYVGNNAAHVVPRRAFENENIWNAFFDTLKNHTERRVTD